MRKRFWGTGADNIADAVYPIGSIYMSVNSTDPGALFGGTWQRIQDAFLLAAGSSYPAGSTGGESSHVLLESEIPAHGHDLKFSSDITISSFRDGKYLAVGANTTSSVRLATVDREIDIHTATDSVVASGSSTSAAHNNMPPYLVVYAWKRTA